MVCAFGFLIITAIGFPVHHGFSLGPFNVSAIAFIIVIGRLAYLKLTLFAENKHHEVIGNNDILLKGEKGRITQIVTPAHPGMVRLENPVWGDDEIECIADEDIFVGEHVKIIEVDCGLLKVAKATSM